MNLPGRRQRNPQLGLKRESRVAQRRWKTAGRRGGACGHLFPEESGRRAAPSTPFLRRAALARSRGFSGSQRVRVSGVFPARPFLPDARKLLLSNRVWGRERAAGASRGSPQRGSGARRRGRGSPPRQTPSGRTHAAGPEWKARASSCTAHASPRPPGPAPRVGGLRSRFARRPAPQAAPRCAPQSPWPRRVPPKG